MDISNVQALFEYLQTAETNHSQQNHIESFKQVLNHHHRYLRAKKLKKVYQRSQKLKELKKYHKRLIGLMKKRSEKYLSELQHESKKIFEKSTERQRKNEMFEEEKFEEKTQKLIESINKIKDQKKNYQFPEMEKQNLLQVFQEYKGFHEESQEKEVCQENFTENLEKCCKQFAKSMSNLKNLMITFLSKGQK